MNGQELKQKRVAAGIAGALLSERARVDRARLCHIERGYRQPSEAEITRLARALNDLIAARRKELSALLSGASP